MDLDEIDWVFIAAVVIGAIASVAREIADFVGVDELNSIILMAKLVAAFLTLVFAIWKFIGLKPAVSDLRRSDFQFEGKGDASSTGKATISSRRHGKGKSPSFETFSVKDDGSIETVGVAENIDSSGNITVSGFIPEQMVLRVVVKK